MPPKNCHIVDPLRLEHWAEYRAWISAKYRCNTPTAKFYERYGGRGIQVCARWLHSFENFLADMGPKPTPKHTIERRDNDGHYEPDNCYWATWREQKLNSTSGPKRADITGQRFVRLVALEAMPKRPLKQTLWRCLCDCGTETFATLCHLRTGHTRSCGCLHRDGLKAWNR